jgi:hypothetical protein
VDSVWPTTRSSAGQPYPVTRQKGIFYVLAYVFNGDAKSYTSLHALSQLIY